jgi:cytochrome c oxidase subunit 3
MFLGLAAIAATLFVWWRDVLHEGRVDKAHTAPVQHGLRFGMALFIISEVMFFVAFFWAYFGAAFFPIAPLTDTWAIAKGVWPPEGIITFDPFDLPFINTLILLLSGTTLTWAHHALLHGHMNDVIRGLKYTVILGVCFTLLQAYEYSHAAFGLADGKYAATFYLATGFHGLHVIIGTIFLAVMLARAKRGTLTKQNHLGFEFAAWYWHFVDVVWLFLFIGIYWFTS